MLVLTWNLFHGRSRPPAGGELSAEFAAMLAAWDWDVTLLQEVPPWWPQQIARCCGADYRLALTSRNLGLRVRRAVAERWPDAIKSNGGGCNAVLARRRIAAHEAVMLRRMPERRVAQLVRLVDGTCVVNYHGSARVPLAEAELEALAKRAVAWCEDGPTILGGDLNLREPRPGSGGLRLVASRDVDHLFARGLEPAGEPQQMDRHVDVGGVTVELSDHVPLAISLHEAGPRAGQATRRLQR